MTSEPDGEVVVPRGLVGSVYGAWPFVAVPMCSLFAEVSWVSADLIGTGAACGAVRASLWARQRRRNRVVLGPRTLELTAEGQTVAIPLGDVEHLEWSFGHPSATFDRMHDYTMLAVHTTDREELVELLLPRVRDQRRALRALGRRLPEKQWTVRWTVASNRSVSWSPAANPEPPRRLSQSHQG